MSLDCCQRLKKGQIFERSGSGAGRSIFSPSGFNPGVGKKFSIFASYSENHAARLRPPPIQFLEDQAPPQAVDAKPEQAVGDRDQKLQILNVRQRCLGLGLAGNPAQALYVGREFSGGISPKPLFKLQGQAKDFDKDERVSSCRPRCLPDFPVQLELTRVP